jgi:hypothetical protein
MATELTVNTGLVLFGISIIFYAGINISVLRSLSSQMNESNSKMASINEKLISNIDQLAKSMNDVKVSVATLDVRQRHIEETVKGLAA